MNDTYIRTLKGTKLFAGIAEDEICSMLSCLDAKSEKYQKGEYVIHQGEHISTIMMLADGKLHIQQDDYWGNRSIISNITAGEMFGEAYIAPESGPVLNDVVALEDSTVIFLDARKIMTVCSSACRFHSIVLQNLFFTISEKNRKLVTKLGHISKRTTREKLISYLSEESRRHNSAEFTIPFNRQQLADFLSVDRSAMSSELCRMRDEGLLHFNKSRFTLLLPEKT